MDKKIFKLPKSHWGWKARMVSVQDKTLSVSAALGSYVDKSFDVYECENVLAFVNSPFGEYKAIPVSRSGERLRINSRPLVRFVKDKYHISGSMKLNAWFDGSCVLFCRGDAGKNTSFHDGFHKVSEPMRYRYDNSVRIIGNRFIISSALSESLERRLTFIELDNGFAFVNDKKGIHYAADRNEFGTRAVKSTELVRYVLKKLGSDILYGIAVRGGVVFSQDRHIKSSEVSLEKGRVLDARRLRTAT